MGCYVGAFSVMQPVQINLQFSTSVLMFPAPGRRYALQKFWPLTSCMSAKDFIQLNLFNQCFLGIPALRLSFTAVQCHVWKALRREAFPNLNICSFFWAEAHKRENCPQYIDLSPLQSECVGVPNPSGSTLVGCKWFCDGKALGITELSWLAQEEERWRANSPPCWVMKFSLKGRLDPWFGSAGVTCPDSAVSSSAGGGSFLKRLFFT